MERLNVKDQLAFTDRLHWVMGIMSAVLAVVWLRVAQLQVVKGEGYRARALSNSMRVVPRRAPRGMIYDRYGKVLAHNKPSYTISVVPGEISPSSSVIPELSRMLNMEEVELRSKLEHIRRRRLELVRVKEQVTFDEIAMVEEHLPELPGVVINVEPRRYYLDQKMSAHLLGYVSQVSEEQVLLNPGRYQIGETAGQDGIERVYDQELRGERGSTRIMVNAKGYELRVMANDDPRMGKDCVLTIDGALQELADRLLEGKRGSIIALDPRNGEILALSSSPFVPLKYFNEGMDVKTWQGLQRHPGKPFYNRAVSAQYPVGSIFKAIVAAAGLERGVLDGQTSVVCRGVFEYGEWKYKCWKKEGHGLVRLSRALAESCDVFFYQAGLRVKVDGISDMARLFGFGERTGVDLPSEGEGLVPTPEWKVKQFDEPWFPGNTMHYAIGQSYLLATPLQIASAFCVIANEGIAYRPHLLKRLGEQEVAPQMTRKVELSPAVWKAVKQGLWEVVHSEGGTGWRARIQGLSVCGKTSTIQHVNKATHGAFVAFAPRELPEIVVIAFLEEGGEGGANASPLVRDILERWQQLKKKERGIKIN